MAYTWYSPGESQISGEFDRHPAAPAPLEALPADHVITIDEKAAPVIRAKRNSSMRVGLRLVREVIAAGFVTQHGQRHGCPGCLS